MTNRQGRIQHPTSAASDELLAAHGDGFLHETRCQRRAYQRLEEAQAFPLIIYLVIRNQTHLRLADINCFSCILFSNLLDNFLEKAHHHQFGKVRGCFGNEGSDDRFPVGVKIYDWIYLVVSHLWSTLYLRFRNACA